MLKLIKGIFSSGKTFMQQSSCIRSFFGSISFNPLLLEITKSTKNASQIIGEWFAGIGGKVLEWFVLLVYFLSKFIFQFIDFCEVLVYKIAGINVDTKFNFDMPIFRMLLSDTFFKIMSSLFILGLIFLVVFTILAIIKSEYQLAVGDEKLEKDKKNGSVSYALKRTALASFMMVIVPLILVVCFAFSSVMLSSINNVLRTDEHSNTSLGGQIFATTAYSANRYRNYANSGQRIPILLDFDDPYQDGSYIYYTSEELKQIYDSWENGETIYEMVRNKNYPSFNDTLAYRGDQLTNSSKFSGFENFISTAEQYYVMADFIDYAVKNNLEFFIKDSADTDIDWSSASKKVQVSGGVYDTKNKTLTINYVNSSGLGGYGEDYYTLNLSTNTVSANSPLQNAIDTLASLMAIELKAAKEEAASSNGLLNNASLTTSEDVGVTVENNKLFRLLERVEDSTNVVRWKTEKVKFNDEYFTVYNLTKRFYNAQTGVVDERGTVQVARKETAGKFYIVRNNNGVYEYTNQTLDYVNDNASYLDKLEPVFVYAGWAEKLYNDLDVIYRDIDFQNYINYDNWADALGEYFSPTSNVIDENVATFATTLIHPLGLIMSELFLGITFEGSNKTGTDFAFTTQYTEDLIKQLCLTVGGQYSYKDIMNEVDTYMRLFNGLLTPVMEDLKEIEGFDLTNESEYSVYAYVYKSYLCSILLSDDFGSYFTDLAYTILNINNLVSNMYNGANSVTYNSDGEKVYEKEYTYNLNGELLPLVTNLTVGGGYTTGKYVYTYDSLKSTGIKVLACDAMGKITEDGAYTINPSYAYKIENGEYLVYLAGEYRNASNYIAYCLANGSQATELSNIFVPYYQISYNEEKTLAYLMVYEPTSSTDKDTSAVKLVKATDEDGNLLTIEVSANENGEINNQDVVKNAMATLSAKYYLYEYEMVAKKNNKCLRFSDLTKTEQELINNCIKTVQEDVRKNNTDEPSFLMFLIEYAEDADNMAEVMSAPNITSTEANEIGKEYLELVGKLANETKERKIKALKQKINSYKKYQIINGLNSYLSTKVSSGFNVVVNGHSYNVGQELTTRKILEYAFGNKLLNASLVNMLNTETTFANLSEYNKQAFINLKNTSSSDIKTLRKVIERLRGFEAYGANGAIELEFTDAELELIYNYYNLYGRTIGVNYLTSYTNRSLERLRGTEAMSNLISGLETVVTDIERVFDRYVNGEGLIFGTSLSTNSEAFKLMVSFVEQKSIEEQLFFVDETFKGAVSDNGIVFESLRTFLKKFGRVCFDLKTKSTYGNLSVNKEDNTDLLNSGYAASLIAALNGILESSDFGSDEKFSINNFMGVSSLKKKVVDAETGKVTYEFVSDLNSVSYAELDAVSKRYLATILSYYENNINQYKAKVDHMTDGWGYAYRYTKGRYSLFENSELYKTYLPEYLEYFIYNVDIDSADFAKDYIYDDYANIINKRTGSEYTHDEKQQYYLDYINAYKNFRFSTNGNLFSSLSKLQQKVIEDCSRYFANQKTNLTSENQSGYNEYKTNVAYANSLKNYISASTDEIKKANFAYAGEIQGVPINTVVNSSTNLINVKNILDFVGLSIDTVGSSLKDIRIAAMRSLRDFNEYAGESVASIRARYLALLYLTSCDYATNLFGEKQIVLYNDNKQIVLDLAGIKDTAEENLVNLRYDSADGKADADEKNGSVFIICLYNAETRLYEPFIFASGADRFSTPVCNYYYSQNGEVTYYPVIAKGIFDKNGNPTAIRRVNGFIEFYRNNVCILNSAILNLEMYYLTVEQVSVAYNPVSFLINGVTKLITGKNIAELISDAFPVIKSTAGLKVAYGVDEATVYHLDQGYCNLNYMFFMDKGIALENLYAPAQINVILLILTTVAVMQAIVLAVYELLANIFKLAIYLVVYPLTVGMYPFRGDAVGEWRKAFTKEFFTTYGYVISINLYFLSLTILQSVGNVMPTITEDGMHLLKNTWMFSNVDVNLFLGIFATTICLLVAVYMIKSISSNMSATLMIGKPLEGKTKGAADFVIKEGEYLWSGEQFKDDVIAARESLTGLPIVGNVFDRSNHYKRQYNKNARKADKYKNQLIKNGIDATVAQRAADVYRNSLDAAVKAAEDRYKQNVHDATASGGRRDVMRTGIINNYQSQQKDFKCDRCGYKTTNKKLKGKTCQNCHIGKYK